MTQELFGRSFRVTIHDKEFGSFDVARPLAFSFSVQRDTSLTPNNANLLFYNLAEETRDHLAQLSGGFGQGRKGKAPTASTKAKKPSKKGVAQAPQTDGVVVRLEVGYGEDIGQIFFGVLRRVSSWRQGADWLTQISGGDAERSIMTSRISKTFVKGTPIASVIKELVATLGVGAGGINNTIASLQETGFLSGGTVLPKAMTCHGDSATILEQFMRSCGFRWHIADNAFYAGPAGVATMPGEGPLFAVDTGLLDTPYLDKDGKVVGKALLHPDLLPGRAFRVESSRVTGNFVCSKSVHSGDSFGGAWEVAFQGDPPAKGSAAAK